MKMNKYVSVLLGIFLACLPVSASAVMSIAICGSSTYTCPPPVTPLTGDASSWGGTMGQDAGFTAISDGNGNQARLPLTSDPSKGVPAPDAAPTAAPNTPLLYQASIGGHIENNASTYQDACSKQAAWFSTNGAPNTTVKSCSATAITLARPCCGDISGTVSTYYGPTACPAGYVVSGSSCVLSNPRAATPDKNCDYTRAASALAVLSDPDCGGGALQPVCNAGGTSCVTAGTNPQTGQPRTIEIRTDPGGGSAIVVNDQGSIGNTTVTNITTVTVSAVGSITGVTGSTTIGPIPSSGSGTGTPVQPVTVNFPSDYARSGEAQAAANTIIPKLDTLHHDLSDTAVAADPLDVDPALMPSLGSAFNNLKSWSLPVHVSTCPAPSIDLSGVLGAGKVFQFNAHCQLVQDHFVALQAAMMVCWSFLALFIVLGA